MTIYERHGYYSIVTNAAGDKLYQYYNIDTAHAYIVRVNGEVYRVRLDSDYYRRDFLGLKRGA